jgi:hypothetical protein
VANLRPQPLQLDPLRELRLTETDRHASASDSSVMKTLKRLGLLV